jgi:cytochrome c oxidase subunit 3
VVVEPDVQYESLDRQHHAGHFGMWLFLGSEAMLFAGLLALYGAYRNMYPHDFLVASQHNNKLLGTVNTVVLLTSSFFVAMSVHFIRHDRARAAAVMLGLTLLCALGFLLIKGIEYTQHFHAGIFPSVYYRSTEVGGSRGVILFFTLYFFLTGLHAIHVLIGMSVILWAMVRTLSGRYSARHNLGLELAGLYWHLVDIIWIFLWPLLYLVK